MSQDQTKKRWTTKTDEQGAVTVAVTPIELSSQSREWKFGVALDTHSVELNDDMIVAAALIDDKGKEYAPLRWEGAGPGGHHREGVLVFSAISPIASAIELKIKNVGGIPERSFRWDVK